MYLEKIEIQGFKSFAEPVALVFNKELTAIVGPNGSGKSNIADAIRWVLGEQSLKLLRGKKSEDVIFAGSDAKGRLGFARVVLHMNNQDHRAAIDYANVVIERSIDRSGESEYLINGAKVRLVDVQILLAKAHVGQKSYSVIGQGTIDSLLSFSAQERKDFFDEATGVRQYQLKKNQALHKLEQTEENLEQAELVLHEIEPRLGTLSRQIRKLERKEDLERQLNEAQTSYYSYLMGGVVRELLTFSGALAREQKALDALAHEQREIQKKLDAEDHERGRTETYSLLQSKLFNAQQEYNSLTKKKIVLEGQQDVELIKSGNTGQVVAQQRLDDLDSRKNTLSITEQELDQEIKKIDAAVRQLKAAAAETAHALKTVERELSAEATAPDRQSLEDRAHLLHQEHDELIQHIEALNTLDALSAFKEKFKNFAQKLKKFFDGLRNTSKNTDHEAHWGRFSSLNAEHQKITTELNAEELSLGIKRHERESLDRRMLDIATEEKKLLREVNGSTSLRQQSQSHDIKELSGELEQKEQEMQELRGEIDSFNQHEERKKSDLMDLQKKFRTLQYDFTLKNNALNEVKITTAKLETKKEDLEKEIAQEAPHCALTEVLSLNEELSRETITTLKRQLAIIGGIDTQTVSEYEEVKEKHGFLTQQTTDLRSAEQSLMELIKDLDEHISKQFQQSFKNINTQFAKYFKQLFNGGTAKLLLQMQTEKESTEEQSFDVNEEGSTEKKKKFKTDRFDYSIEIQATPPGKKLSSITMLSGGEKALTSIALICSIIANNPPPFVVLDEVDAALDEANSIRFAEIISELIDKSQFITITHNRATMHQAKILYGVSMNESGVSQLLSVNFADAEKLAT